MASKRSFDSALGSSASGSSKACQCKYCLRRRGVDDNPLKKHRTAEYDTIPWRRPDGGAECHICPQAIAVGHKGESKESILKRIHKSPQAHDDYMDVVHAWEDMYNNSPCGRVDGNELRQQLKKHAYAFKRARFQTAEKVGNLWPFDLYNRWFASADAPKGKQLTIEHMGSLVKGYVWDSKYGCPDGVIELRNIGVTGAVFEEELEHTDQIAEFRGGQVAHTFKKAAERQLSAP